MWMSIEQIIVLALIQGITEFLPISSSGHLILVPALTGWPDQGVLTDMVTNLGTLAAGVSATVAVSVQTRGPGRITGSASVVMLARDVNPGNNSATTTTTVDP